MLADEPTASLDDSKGMNVVRMLAGEVKSGARVQYATKYG